jgi:hypothetical protein
MNAWRVLGAVGCLLATWAPGWGQTWELTEPVQAGDCFQVQVTMKLKGEMRISQNGTQTPLSLEAEGSHTYPERVMVVGKDSLIDKTVRLYDKAEAKISVGPDVSQRKLRGERKLIVVQRTKEKHLVYSPSGALFRDELDLTSEQFDTLSVTGLLAGKAVKVGDTWKLPSPVVQALCGFEGLTEHTLEGKLVSAKDNVAVLSITGTATGIDLGALVKLTVEAVGKFDVQDKHLTDLEWKQKDEREQGPVSPKTVVQTTTVLKRQAIEQPSTLTDAALVSVPDNETPPPAMTQIDYRDGKGRYDLLHTRDWQLVGQTADHLVLRLMDRGDFLAQATITPWTPAGDGKHLTGEEFKALMDKTPGWEPEKELQGGEVPSEGGKLWVYRYSTLGQLDGVAVLQNFYLIASPNGDQVVVTFTMTPKQADKLGARDLSLVGSLNVPAQEKK